MSTIELICHPLSSRHLCSSLNVTCDFEQGRLALQYTVVGMDPRLRFPDRSEGGRQDDLWRRTCFEAFVKRRGEPSYYEFNFSPSSAWAAYRFAGYRQGQQYAMLPEPPKIELKHSTDHYQLVTDLDLNRLLPPVASADLLLGLSAVLEDSSGECSYWALLHPAEQPDFHHEASFALTLRDAGSKLEI